MNWQVWWTCPIPFVVACTPNPSPISEPPNLAGYPTTLHTSIGLEVRLVPPGTFAMGAEDGPANERPVHQVRLTRPFYVGTTEVTHEQFAAFIADTGYVTTAETSGGAKVWRDSQWIMVPDANHKNVFPGPKRPVVAVSFDDAVAFCDWLTLKERANGTLAASARIRLPTEAEWEYAARAGTNFPWSGAEHVENLCRYANVPDQAADRAGLGRPFVPCNDGVALETSEVARYQPNAYGLYDMSGNVWEWTSDWMGPYSPGATTNPRGAPQGDERVMRGGSWSGNLHGLRVSHRDAYPHDLRGGAIGFRVVVEMDAGP